MCPLAGRNSPLYIYTFKAVSQCGPVVVKWCILRIGLDVWSSFPVVSAHATHCFTFSHIYSAQMYSTGANCFCTCSHIVTVLHRLLPQPYTHLFFIFLHIKRCTSSLVCTHTTQQTHSHTALSSSSTLSIL